LPALPASSGNAWFIGLYFGNDRFCVSRYLVHPLPDWGCAMQIDRYTHLQFPRNNTPNASENESTGVPL
jgi:hypothetical protein